MASRLAFDNPPCLVYHLSLIMVINGTQKLYETGKTVFTLNDLALNWGITSRPVLLNRVNYWSKKDKLISLKRGLYALNPNYSKYEVAQKLLTPSYISLHTVLAMEGLVFQYDPSIYCVANLSRKFKVGEDAYIYKKVKDDILYNKAGILDKGGYFIASKERAFLDQLYLVSNYYFDNLDDLDWDKVFQILPIYGIANLEKVVRSYAK